MPKLVDYLIEVRGYSRQTVMDVCRVITELRNIGYDDAKIISSNAYELAEIMRAGRNVSKGWSKSTRSSITKFVDFSNYMNTTAVNCSD